jgi:hypothetical protein
MQSNLVEITKSEFGSRKFLLCCALCIREGDLFILLENARITTEKPLADGHLSFWLPLACC